MPEQKQKSISTSSDSGEYMFWTVYVNAVSDDKNWNKFMRHLIKEFAVENLCFVLEAIQFKTQLIVEPDKLFKKKNQTEDDKQSNNNNNSVHNVFVNDKNIGWFMKLPNGLPQSSIIVNSKRNYIEQIDKIYEKYIANDALLQINISFEAREEFMTDYHQIINYAAEMPEKIVK